MNVKLLNKKCAISFLTIVLILASCSKDEVPFEETKSEPVEEVDDDSGVPVEEENEEPVKEEENNKVAATGVQLDITPNVFITSGVGYQGPSQEEINALPEFVIDVLPTNTATQRIQSAVDRASNAGGGRVIIKTGEYFLKAINLKSNVHVRLQPDVIINADQRNTSPEVTRRTKEIFLIGRRQNVRNISVVGEGVGSSRVKFRYFRESERGQGGARSFSVNGVTNCFIQNILIEDNETRFSGICFNFNFIDISRAGRPTNITIDNCEIKQAAYGYGLIQLNAGLNVLLSNLTGEGGVTARLESDNRTFGSKDIGIENAHVKNVLTKDGNTSILLQPWNVINGNVFIDGIHAINCNFAVETQDGYMDNEGRGRYGVDSYIKNVSHEYGLTATNHFAHQRSIPNCLLRFFKRNDNPDAEDSGARVGPSVSVVGDFITREANRIRVFKETISAMVPENADPANTVDSRSKILVGKSDAHRGNDPSKQCGIGAYN